MSKRIKQTLEIGRIDYLSSKGTARACTEYLDEELMIAEIKECLNYGIPISIVLYRDNNGNTISKKFIEELDCLPAGFKEIDYPYG